MTEAFKRGFMDKLAEFQKKALKSGVTVGLGGAAAGAAVGALADEEDRLRGALIGTILGGAGGYGIGSGISGIKGKHDKKRNKKSPPPAQDSKKGPGKPVASKPTQTLSTTQKKTPPNTQNNTPTKTPAVEAKNTVKNETPAQVKTAPKGPDSKQPAATEKKPVATQEQKKAPAPDQKQVPVQEKKPETKSEKKPVKQQAAKTYKPPEFVGLDPEGHMIRVDKFDMEKYKARLAEIRKAYSITFSGGKPYYHDVDGKTHDILKEDFGVPENYVVMPIDAANKRVQEIVQPKIDAADAMGSRYKLKGALREILDDKERRDSAIKEWYGQYTPLGGKVSADTELVDRLYKALAANHDDEKLKEALAQLGRQLPITDSNGTQFGTYRATPVTIDLGDLRGSAEKAKAGRPDLELMRNEATIKRILKLLDQ